MSGCGDMYLRRMLAAPFGRNRDEIIDGLPFGGEWDSPTTAAASAQPVTPDDTPDAESAIIVAECPTCGNTGQVEGDEPWLTIFTITSNKHK